MCLRLGGRVWRRLTELSADWQVLRWRHTGSDKDALQLDVDWIHHGCYSQQRRICRLLQNNIWYDIFLGYHGRKPVVVLCVCVFLNFWWPTCPSMGPRIPLFWTSGDVSSGWEALFVLSRGTCDVYSLRFTSGVTPAADLLTASMAASRCSLHALGLVFT